MHLIHGPKLPFLTIFLSALFIVFVGIKINLTSTDEVFFADPAINFVENGSYLTAAWNITKENETHVSTAPMYSLLLIAWFDLVGWGPTTTRLLPAFLAIASSLILLLACKKLSIVRTPLAGALVVAIFLMDYGFSFSYTCGRPDSLSALMAVLLLYLYAFPNNFWKILFTATISFLMPFTQYGLVIYVLALLPAFVLFFKQKVLSFAILIFTFVVLGFLFQYILYSYFGVWDAWIATIRSEGSESILQRIFKRLTSNPLENHSGIIPKDFSAVMLFFGTFFLFLKNLITKNTYHNKILGFGVIVAFSIFGAMYFIGKFPTYYGWMLALPLAVVIAHYFEVEGDCPKSQSNLALAVAVFAIMLGLPLQAFLATYDWKDRQPAEFQAWLDNKIDKNDIVYCDYPFYFFVKNKAQKVYTGFYYELMTEEDKSKVSVAIISKNFSKWKDKGYFSRRPGISAVDWKPSRGALLGNNYEFGFLSAPNYECTVYRLK